MTQFAIVDPRKRTMEGVLCETVTDAQYMAGIGRSGVDHGVVTRDETGGIAIVVSEFGLFEPKERQAYFGMGGRLYAGNAVLYGFNPFGATVDLERAPEPVWFADASEVEAAILAGIIHRPQMTLNGAPIWEWPQPRPEGF